jgi:hypothetical protein
MRRVPLLPALSVIGLLAACTTHSSAGTSGDAGATGARHASDATPGGVDASAPPRSGAVDAGPLACRSETDCPKNLPDCHDDYTTGGPHLYGTGCTHDGRCPGGLICVLADAGARFGTCEAVTCTDDSQCSSGLVCGRDERLPDASPGDSGICLPSCAGNPLCPATETCDEGGHCRPRTCAECPSYFSCQNGTCKIPNCAKDQECPGGYCVNGQCGEKLGMCSLPIF